MSLSSISYLHSLTSSGMKFGLERMISATNTLNNPQNKFPAVHIAGTNGKGSVTAMLAHVFQKSGYKVGMYTSPHLEKINERFQINGRTISDQKLNQITSFIRKKIFPLQLTQFEFLTLISFEWFNREKVDVAIVEAGLGGRLDATNILGNKILSVITNIAFDHMEYLGETISKIAFEKAGIIQNSVPVVTGAVGEALSVIRHQAEKKKSKVVVPNKKDYLKSSQLGLKGEHQRLNAALVVESAKELNRLGFKLPIPIVRSAIKSVFWPGRFEIFYIPNKNKVQKVILDGAHNPAAMKVLAQTLRDQKINKVRLFIGGLRDKDLFSMNKMIKKFASETILVPVSSDRTESAENLSKLGWVSPRIYKSPVDGWNYIKSVNDNLPVLVTGSLYLVGEIRALIKKGRKK
ncbi:MAG: bifunctional folylpolyglutamate synthase/dihydrofolate synthase [Elusimicrobiota bacterium]